MINSGAGLTTGASSSSSSIQSAYNNPASGPLLLSDTEKWRMSYLPVMSVNMELGQVDNFSEDLNELTDIVDNPDSTSDNPTQVLNRFNKVLVEMGESGYIKNNVSFNAPLLPLYYRIDSSSVIGVGVKVGSQTGLRLLDDSLSFDSQNGSFSTASVIYIKNGIETEAAVSYSRSIFKISEGGSTNNQLYAGAKLKLINLRLSKQVFPLQQLDDSNVEDLVWDEYDNNLNSSTNIGLDLGIVWDSDLFRLGLVLENINSPEFSYGSIGQDCSKFAENTHSRNTCEAAAYFINNKGDIKGKEVHTKVSMFRFDGLAKLTNRWALSMALDISEYNDLVGFDNRWLNIATTYERKGNIFSSLRLGYQKNLAGTSTSSAMLGLTFFSLVSLDLEYGLQSIKVDGSKYPRRLGISLSVEESF
ncbi:MAG: conjugal transfer protein TraF [Gammaproteobacteria bacterium]|nr:conjugal transfer protein TraF [Gammaproteobacteria bacterium]